MQAPMATLPILIYPEPMLGKVARDVVQVDDAIRALARDMLETMYDAPGLGLAAPQVGVGLRVLVMDCAPREEESAPRVLINPVILHRGEERDCDSEGCLSLPGLTADVERNSTIRAGFLDGDGLDCEEEFVGLWAWCLQHEIDHLDVRLFVDRLSRLKRQVLLRRFMREFHQGKTRRPKPGRTRGS